MWRRGSREGKRRRFFDEPTGKRPRIPRVGILGRIDLRLSFHAFMSCHFSFILFFSPNMFYIPQTKTLTLSQGQTAKKGRERGLNLNQKNQAMFMYA